MKQLAVWWRRAALLTMPACLACMFCAVLTLDRAEAFRLMLWAMGLLVVCGHQLKGAE